TLITLRGSWAFGCLRRSVLRHRCSRRPDSARSGITSGSGQGPTNGGVAEGVGACRNPVADGHRRIVKITPAWRVYILGATLCVALTVSSRNFGDRGGPYFMASFTLAGIAYLLAIREFFATPGFSLRVVVIGLVLAAVWHIEFLRVPSGADDDIHRYVWDGRLQRLGYNPYMVVPSDPAAKGLHTPETRNLNNPDLPSPYPAGA